MFDFHKNWMEFFFFLLMVIGVLIALLSPSAVISYFIIFISGIFAGRLIFERKHKIKFPYLIIICGFLIGYALGIYYGSRWVVIFLFIISTGLSYILFNKKMLKDFRF